jgi:glycosyltransferase involved in cell wall biosynthesis
MTSRKKKLALIGTNGIPAMYGGAETFYENLVRELHDVYDITVYCSNRQPKDKIGNTYLGAKLKYYPMSANGWQSVPYDMLSILHAAKHSDILYIFGASAPFVVCILRFFGFKKKVYLNDGGLNEWEREKSTKLERWYSKWNRKVTKGKIDHIVDNELYVKSLYNTFGITNVNVIRYGGDQAVAVKADKELIEKYPFLTEKYYVAVARAQVDNNLHLLLEAFSMMPTKKLVLVSNFKVSQYGMDLYSRYKDKYPNMILIPGIYDKHELNAVRSNAVAYIHSHSRCGTPPSLCEAMNLGLPIISFNAEVNHEVTQEHALFFSNALELKDIIENSTEDKLQSIAKESLAVAKKELTWKHIASQYIELFGK